ncbi:hypothetical protein [Nostoc sp.]|uniref:hypothetical protein n=1 Tax=Nostoc sp. TaxID=1180 RepID=UPI0035933D86
MKDRPQEDEVSCGLTELYCNAVELSGGAIELLVNAVELSGGAIELLVNGVESSGGAIELSDNTNTKPQERTLLKNNCHNN